MNARIHTPEELTLLRLRMHRNSYAPVPVIGAHVDTASAGKRPVMSGWQVRCLNATPDEIRTWTTSERDSTNTGILCGKVVGIDIDVLDRGLAAELVARCEAQFGYSPLRRIGREPKILLCYRVVVPFKKMQTPDLFFEDGAKAKVEILAEGQQFVAFGIHPDTRAPYRWPEKSPVDVPASDLPLVEQEDLRKFVAESERLLRAAGSRTGRELKNEAKSQNETREQDGKIAAAFRQGEKPSREMVSAALDFIPNDMDYDEWVRIGFALYDGLGSGASDLWERWSARSGKNNPKITAAKWPSFAGGGAVTIATLFWNASQNGWRRSGTDQRHTETSAPPPGDKTKLSEQAPSPNSARIKATPYTRVDPKTIPPRDWLYGNLLVRQFVTATVSPGGVGKSSLVTAETLSMASGKDLLGILPRGRLKVWLWNLEDPQIETQRKIEAAAMHYRLPPEDTDGWLFVNSGRDQPLVIAQTLPEGAVIIRPVVDNLISEIIVNGIDVLIVDPFVSSHEVGENDNTAMDMIIKEWGRVTSRADIAVHLVDHSRKSMNGDIEVTVESSRGAKSKTDGCRVVRVINRMTKDEGEKAGVQNHRLYFRTYNDKANLAPPAESAEWFKLESVDLGNGPESTCGMEGDSVGVVVRWAWPDTLAGITGAKVDAVFQRIKSGKWRENHQARDWVGVAVAETLGLDLSKSRDKARIIAMIKIWKHAGSLVVVDGLDGKGTSRPFIEVSEAAK